MLFAYVDETGGTGSLDLKGSHLSYTLGCVLLHEKRWAPALDQLVQFRRGLRDNFGIPVRAELKANYLIRGTGPLAGLDLSTSQRKLIFRYHLQMLHRINAGAFAVVIDKRDRNIHGEACLKMGWDTLLQRLERTANYHAEKPNVMLIHDEGENDKVRGYWRRSRRYLPAGSSRGTGVINNAALAFIDDPIPRTSHQSYFIQLADIVAYSAWRTVVAPGKSVARVVPGDSWRHVGEATHRKVNATSGGTPGIVWRKG